MAVSISLPFSDDTCYSWQLQDIAVSSSAGSQVYFCVYAIAQDGHATRTQIFNSTYAIYQTSVSIADIGAVIETYLLQNDLPVAQFAISARRIASPDVDERTLWVVYSHQQRTDIPAAQLLTDHFLTNRLQRITCRSARETLPFFTLYGSVGGYTAYIYDIQATYKQPDGTIGTCSASISGRAGYGVTPLNVSPAGIESNLLTQMPDNAVLLAYTIRLGNRTASFYITDFTNCLTFQFRNAYACNEYLTLPIQLTEKLSSKSSLAQCSDSLSQYNIRHTRTYEVLTPIQTLSDARLFEEFLTSSYIELQIDFRFFRILITDYTFEVNDNPGNANSIKFEFRFADLRQALPFEEYTRIFSPEYTPPFV